MKIAFRYTEHRHLEMPDICSVNHNFKPVDPKSKCFCVGLGPRRQKIKIATIPWGKRYFESTPNKAGCDPLIAKTATLQELRDFYRPQCCNNGGSNNNRSRY